MATEAALHQFQHLLDAAVEDLDVVHGTIAAHVPLCLTCRDLLYVPFMPVVLQLRPL